MKSLCIDIMMVIIMLPYDKSIMSLLWRQAYTQVQFDLQPAHHLGFRCKEVCVQTLNSTWWYSWLRLWWINNSWASCEDFFIPCRLTKDTVRFKDELDIMKFICKDFWTCVFKKQIDNLRTNHQVTLSSGESH